MSVQVDDRLPVRIARDEPAAPVCPVDRLPRVRRNRICLRVIMVGLLNFLLYAVFYAAIGGDAHNGDRVVRTLPDGSTQARYYVRGHFIRSRDGQVAEVNRYLWIYSYLHSITIWITSGAMIVSMLVLARPHIIATMRSGWISGQTFVTIFGTVVVLITAGATIVFTWDFVRELSAS